MKHKGVSRGWNNRDRYLDSWKWQGIGRSDAQDLVSKCFRDALEGGWQESGKNLEMDNNTPCITNMEQIVITNPKPESLPETIQEIMLATKFHDYNDSYLDKQSSVTQIPAGETVVAEILPLSLHLPSLVWLDTTSLCCWDEFRWKRPARVKKNAQARDAF